MLSSQLDSWEWPSYVFLTTGKAYGRSHWAACNKTRPNILALHIYDCLTFAIIPQDKVQSQHSRGPPKNMDTRKPWTNRRLLLNNVLKYPWSNVTSSSIILNIYPSDIYNIKLMFDLVEGIFLGILGFLCTSDGHLCARTRTHISHTTQVYKLLRSNVHFHVYHGLNCTSTHTLWVLFPILCPEPASRPNL